MEARRAAPSGSLETSRRPRRVKGHLVAQLVVALSVPSVAGADPAPMDAHERAILIDSAQCYPPRPSLRARLRGEGPIEGIRRNLDRTDNGQLATSYLVPPRPKGAPWREEARARWTWEDAAARYRWCSRHAPGAIADGDPSTAWAEGVEGPGHHEIVVAVGLDPRRPVEIFSGHGKSTALFRQNRRPRRVRVHLLRSTQPSVATAPWEGDYELYSAARVIGRAECTLRDHFGYQPLCLPKVENPPVDEATLFEPHAIAIEIIDTYPGTRYPDTCISEVRNAAAAPPVPAARKAHPPGE